MVKAFIGVLFGCALGFTLAVYLVANTPTIVEVDDDVEEDMITTVYKGQVYELMLLDMTK